MTDLGGKSSANLTYFGFEKILLYIYLLLLDISMTKIQVIDLGGKSSANLTNYGCEKTLAWYLPPSIEDFSDESASDGFRWQKFG